MPVEIAADGTAVFFAHIPLVIPDVPSIVSTRIDVQRVGATGWNVGAVLHVKGTQTVRVGPLSPGLTYNFRAVTVGAMESTPMFLNNFLAPGDTTAPGTPSTPTIQAQHLREFTFQTTAPSDADLKDLQWHVRTASGGAGELVMEGTATAIRAAVSTIKVTLPASVPYASTRWFRVRARDFSGNPTDPTTGWSASLSFSASPATAPDYGAGSIGNAPLQINAVERQNIINDAIDEFKRRAPYITTFGYSVGAGVGANQTVTVNHSAGRLPSTPVAFPGVIGPNVTMSISRITTGIIDVIVVNLSPDPRSGTGTLHYW